MVNDRRILWLALAVGVLPLLAAHLAYLISAAEGRVPWCLPYWDGCTSISRAARHGPASWLFKSVMLPVALLMMLLWQHLAAPPGHAAQQHRRRRGAMRFVGTIGAAFLILYLIFLGAEGEGAQWMRRYGVTVYFAFTVLAQMLFASQLPAARSMVERSLVGLCAAMLLLGLASIPLQHLVVDRDAMVNAIEWWYALLMTSFFPLAGVAAIRRQVPERKLKGDAEKT